jgi:anti-anti-sigma regulatory factor
VGKAVIANSQHSLNLNCGRIEFFSAFVLLILKKQLKMLKKANFGDFPTVVEEKLPKEYLL